MAIIIDDRYGGVNVMAIIACGSDWYGGPVVFRYTPTLPHYHTTTRPPHTFEYLLSFAVPYQQVRQRSAVQIAM
jgi:hypothetical protein